MFRIVARLPYRYPARKFQILSNMAGLISTSWIFALVVVMHIQSIRPMAEPVKDEDFVDPLDMLNFDPVNMRMKEKVPSQEPTAATALFRVDPDDVKEVEHCAPHIDLADDICERVKTSHEVATRLLRQYAMSLVQLMESKISSTSEPTLLDLRVKATYHGLGQLRQFGEGTTSDFHALHETLTSLVQNARPVAVESSFTRFFWLEDMLGLSVPIIAYVTLLTVSFALILVSITRLRVTRNLIGRSLFVTFIISVVMNMVEMYQGKLAEQEQQLRKSIKEQCPGLEDLSFWQKLHRYSTSHFYFESDDCDKFMEAVFVNPVFAVSPMQAVAVAVVKTVVTPMDLIGQGLKNFLVGLLKGLPMQMQTFVLVCLFVLLILLPLVMMGYHFNFFYLINIGPGQQTVREVQYVHSDSCPSVRPSEPHQSLCYLRRPHARSGSSDCPSVQLGRDYDPQGNINGIEALSSLSPPASRCAAVETARADSVSGQMLGQTVSLERSYAAGLVDPHGGGDVGGKENRCTEIGATTASPASRNRMIQHLKRDPLGGGDTGEVGSSDKGQSRQPPSGCALDYEAAGSKETENSRLCEKLACVAISDTTMSKSDNEERDRSVACLETGLGDGSVSVNQGQTNLAGQVKEAEESKNTDEEDKDEVASAKVTEKIEQLHLDEDQNSTKCDINLEEGSTSRKSSD